MRTSGMTLKDPHRSGARPRRARLLVIDDERSFGDAVSRALSGESDVVVVDRASDALDRLRAGERYDVVLCDVMMSEIDGIEFHRRLSEVLPEEAARVVFITGAVLTARIDAFIARTRNLLLEKPVDVEGLRALLERRVRGDVPIAAAGRGGRAYIVDAGASDW
jgi:CheY-like chemotaxis protein